MIEVKVSRSDFLADKKKPERLVLVLLSLYKHRLSQKE